MNVRRTKNGCWLWQGAKTHDGYAKNRDGLVHVQAWEQHHDRKVPRWGNLDHLCRRRHCVNPDHLELVTPRENTLRGNGPTAINARKKLCVHGHSLVDPRNVWIERNASGGVHRRCRKCQRKRQDKRKRAVAKVPRQSRPTRGELARHNGKPATTVALVYGVSDTTIRNWRRAYGL